MLTKWYFLGLKSYFSSAWNLLDAFIVFTSLLNFVLTYQDTIDIIMGVAANVNGCAEWVRWVGDASRGCDAVGCGVQFRLGHGGV